MRREPMVGASRTLSFIRSTPELLYWNATDSCERAK